MVVDLRFVVGDWLILICYLLLSIGDW